MFLTADVRFMRKLRAPLLLLLVVTLYSCLVTAISFFSRCQVQWDTYSAQCQTGLLTINGSKELSLLYRPIPHGSSHQSQFDLWNSPVSANFQQFVHRGGSLGLTTAIPSWVSRASHQSGIWALTKNTFLSAFFQSLVLASILCAIFYLFIYRHLNQLAWRLGHANVNLDANIIGERKSLMSRNVAAIRFRIGSLQTSIQGQLKRRAEAEYRLKKLNANLEQEVERRIKENESQRATLESNARLSLIGEMAGGIAHEINNPLTIIYGYATIIRRLMEQKPLMEQDKAIDIAKKIERTTERISRIINGLLNLSREPDNSSYKREKVQRIIYDSLAICQEKFNRCGIKLKVNMPPEG